MPGQARWTDPIVRKNKPLVATALPVTIGSPVAAEYTGEIRSLKPQRRIKSEKKKSLNAERRDSATQVARVAAFAGIADGNIKLGDALNVSGQIRPRADNAL